MGRAAHDFHDAFSRHRAAEQIALCAFAAKFPKTFALILPLDTFGGNVQAEALREIGDRPHHGLVLLVGAEISHEAAIDLRWGQGKRFSRLRKPKPVP